MRTLAEVIDAGRLNPEHLDIAMRAIETETQSNIRSQALRTSIEDWIAIAIGIAVAFFGLLSWPVVLALFVAYYLVRRLLLSLNAVVLSLDGAAARDRLIGVALAKQLDAITTAAVGDGFLKGVVQRLESAAEDLRALSGRRAREELADDEVEEGADS